MCLQYLGIPSLLQTACLRFPALPSEFNLQVEVHQFYLRGFTELLEKWALMVLCRNRCLTSVFRDLRSLLPGMLIIYSLSWKTTHVYLPSFPQMHQNYLASGLDESLAIIPFSSMPHMPLLENTNSFFMSSLYLFSLGIRRFSISMEGKEPDTRVTN